MSDAMHPLLAATPLLALLRAVGTPCRFDAFTIDKPLQKGAITGLDCWLAPQRIIHSRVDASLEDRWITLEGFILDATYLASLQRRFPQARQFCGYGAATGRPVGAEVEWRGQDTHIQKEGIADDFGIASGLARRALDRAAQRHPRRNGWCTRTDPTRTPSVAALA